MNLSIDHRIDVSRKLQEAVHCHKTGRLESAEKGYRRILEILPDHADTLHLLGLVYSEKGALSKAKEFIQRAIQVDVGVPIFYVSFGDVLQREGSLAEAAFFYRKALQLNPNLVEALCNLGNTLCGLEDYEQALELRLLKKLRI